MTIPRKGDYVQLLDANFQPSENFTYVDVWRYSFFARGQYVGLVWDVQGEEYIIKRNENLDTDEHRGWTQVILD